MRTKTFMAGAAIAAMSTIGCGIFPIQAARVTQVESYHHEYRLNYYGGNAGPKGDLAVRIFEQLLGEENRCSAGRSKVDWLPYLNAAVNGEIEAAGQFALTISLYPWNHDKFFVEGQGNYVARSRDKDPDRLLASADFRIVDGAALPIDTTKDHIDVLMSQYVVRQFFPASPRFVHESYLVARIWLKPIPKKKAYTIDYARWHDLAVGVRRKNETLVMAVPAGCLHFHGGGDGRKLVDFSQHDSSALSSDYKKSLDELGYHEGHDELHVDWVENLPSLCGSTPPSPAEVAMLRARAEDILPSAFTCPLEVAGSHSGEPDGLTSRGQEKLELNENGW